MFTKNWVFDRNSHLQKEKQKDDDLWKQKDRERIVYEDV